MKKISLWASQHTWLTRFIILLIYIFLNIVGWIIGDLLTSFNIHFNSLLLAIPCLLGILGLYLYPFRKKNALYIIFYRRHKIGDLLLATSTFLFIVISGNRLDLWYSGTDAQANIDIAGALNLAYTDMIDSTNAIKPTEVLLKNFQAVLPDKNKEVVTYCFIGQTASVIYLTGRALGYNVKVYDGSMQEWSRIPELPMEKTKKE